MNPWLDIVVDEATIGRIFRAESGRPVAALIRLCGDIDLAEDAVQEAFAIALRRWPADGTLVLLAEQDRTRWDHALIEEGHAIVRRCLHRNRPGPYQIQAAINAVHADATTAEQTDWPQILALYNQLLPLAPTPVVALNRAVAVGEVHGPAAALTLVDQLELDGYYAFHATRADLLRRLGRHPGTHRRRAGLPAPRRPRRPPPVITMGWRGCRSTVRGGAPGRT